MTAELDAVEYLYGIEAGHCDANDDWQPARVVQFRVVRKTVKRIYYIRCHNGPRPVIGYVNRQQIERDGEVVRASAGWWESDLRLYLKPPDLPECIWKPDLGALRAAMAEAHPDRGGSPEAFVAARDAYLKARGDSQQA